MTSKGFIFALVVAIAIAVADAFTIPSDLPDGIYAVTASTASGSDELVFLRNVDHAAGSAKRQDNTITGSNRLSKRVNWPKDTSPHCTGNYFWEIDFYSFSYQGFYKACTKHFNNGDRIKEKRAVFQKYGTSVAYMCNYSSKGNPCDPSEWAEAVQWIANTCNDVENGWRQGGECGLRRLLPSFSGYGSNVCCHSVSDRSKMEEVLRLRCCRPRFLLRKSRLRPECYNNMHAFKPCPSIPRSSRSSMVWSSHSQPSSRRRPNAMGLVPHHLAPTLHFIMES